MPASLLRARPGRQVARAPYDHGQPLHRPDSLPILLFVFALIAALMTMTPRQTHALIVDLPAPPPPGLIAPLSPNYDRLAILPSGQPLWNGTPVSEEYLQAMLQERRGMPHEEALMFTPHADARYEDVVAVLATLRKSGVLDRCFRFAEIARYRHYDRPDTFDDLTQGDLTMCSRYWEG